MLISSFSVDTARKFILGRQGLWPGRRWRGKEGAAAALRQMEQVQLDPLNIVARSQDIAMWGRVLDYQPEMLDELTYTDRQFFDYGGTLFLYPMTELPYWQVHMQARAQDGDWGNFTLENASLLESMRSALRERGPLGNRHFNGSGRIQGNYRGRKETSLALYALWITGEVMVHHRSGFQRIYDLRENIIPPELCAPAPLEAAEEYFGRKAVSFYGLITPNGWRNVVGNYLHRKILAAEGDRMLARLIHSGIIDTVQVHGWSEPYIALSADIPLLDSIDNGFVPDAWQPLDTTTLEEAVFLAPLEIVSARGRAKKLFDFEYLWEVYKPIHQRRWGYYTLPILYGDRLVARLDPRLDRPNHTLVINGYWQEDPALAEDPAYAAALGRCLRRFRTFLHADRVVLDAIQPDSLRATVAQVLD